MNETKPFISLRQALLPNELCFGAFLLVTWLRLIFAIGLFRADTLIFFALLALNVLLIGACIFRQTNFRWRMRLLFYPVAMSVSYFEMRFAVPAIHPRLVDVFLQRVDHWMVGTNLSLRMESFIHPGITEFMSFCYFVFFPYLVFSMVWYLAQNLEVAQKFYVGLFTVYGIGFLGYTVLPALGPHLAMTHDFSTPLVGWRITQWNSAIVLSGSNRVDVFPSLHCAVSSYILFSDRAHKPWRFWLYLVPCAGLWVSTIYLRYHYFVDLIAGFVLFGFSQWIAAQYARQSAKGTRHEIPARV